MFCEMCLMRLRCAFRGVSCGSEGMFEGGAREFGVCLGGLDMGN
jgi:hypothetical protein